MAAQAASQQHLSMDTEGPLVGEEAEEIELIRNIRGHGSDGGRFRRLLRIFEECVDVHLATARECNGTGLSQTPERQSVWVTP